MNHPNAPELKLPPMSIEAEQSLLGGLLLDNEAIDRIGSVLPEHFYRDDHKRIYRAIVGQIQSGREADILTVAEALRESGDLDNAGGQAYLVDLASSTASAANIHNYARIVRERALERSLMAVGDEIAATVYDKTRGVMDKLNHAQALVMSLTEGAAPREPRLLKDVLVSVLDEMDRRMNGQVIGVPTGLADLDQALSGGLQPGDLVLIAGRPAMGKTTLGVQIAQSFALDGGIPLVLSMEMSEVQLGSRMLASVGRVPLQDVIHGHVHGENADRMAGAIARLSEARVVIDDQPALTVMDVRAKARSCRRKHGLGLVVVDYLQLMQGDGDNRNSQLEEISRGLKALAKELNVPVVALSQLSRKCEERTDRRPMMSDLRDSGALEQDADVIMFVYRDEVYHSDSPDAGTAEVLIRKQRQGATGMARLTFLGQYVRFEDCAYQGTRRVTELKPKTRRRYGEDD